MRYNISSSSQLLHGVTSIDYVSSFARNKLATVLQSEKLGAALLEEFSNQSVVDEKRAAFDRIVSSAYEVYRYAN